MILNLLYAAVLLAAGFALGRARLGHRASDWAHWQTTGTPPDRRTARWWAVFAVLSAENLAWIVAHPVQARHAWRHRNDPPPPRGPAPKIDPNWAENRRARLTEEGQQ
ncbi:hypothetical protein [Streptomyces ortus]|uniref:Uncharacterized protein n=1 Tax=Streptomyces ortus TaxID=2867268 RepID=A0ABT3UWY7_9ACTN|nr:hypothetical protein [Streptomyces ortus]MCX4232073.1 hypothetical protein [Streptomyces ortus]